MGTNEWVALGTLLTAVFTGLTAWWTFRQRPRPIIKIELDSIATSIPPHATLSVVYSIKNVGTGPAFQVRTFLTAPGLPDKQHGQTVASLPAGEEIKLQRGRTSISPPRLLNESTGEYSQISSVFDPKEYGIAVTWSQPPRHRRKRDQRELESQLLADFQKRHLLDPPQANSTAG